MVTFYELSLLFICAMNTRVDAITYGFYYLLKKSKLHLKSTSQSPALKNTLHTNLPLQIVLMLIMPMIQNSNIFKQQIHSPIMETSVMVFYRLPFFFRHFERVRAIDPKRFGFRELFLRLEQPICFIVPVDDHAGQYQSIDKSLALIGPSFRVSNGTIAVHK